MHNKRSFFVDLMIGIFFFVLSLIYTYITYSFNGSNFTINISQTVGKTLFLYIFLCILALVFLFLITFFLGSFFDKKYSRKKGNQKVSLCIYTILSIAVLSIILFMRNPIPRFVVILNDWDYVWYTLVVFTGQLLTVLKSAKI